MDFRERIGTLRRDVAGEVILPEDAAYERRRKVWNADFDLYPAMIVRASRVDDVVAALAFTRDADLEITVRGGGHSFSGQSVADGALMIDLRRLCAVNVDARAAHARPGRRDVARGGRGDARGVAARRRDRAPG